jgi:hypothetical protein
MGPVQASFAFASQIDFSVVISTDECTKQITLLPISAQISFFHSEFVGRKRL